jgi:hypothetical protein
MLSARTSLSTRWFASEPVPIIAIALSMLESITPTNRGQGSASFEQGFPVLSQEKKELSLEQTKN